MSKTNIPAGGLPCDRNRSGRNALWFAGRCRRTKTEAGRMGRQGGESMNQANITAEGCPVTEAELEAIARYSRRRLTAEEVYTFPLVLCDNDLDRDHERCV